MAEDEGAAKLKLGDLRKMITDTVSEVMKGVKTEEGDLHDKAQEHTESRLGRSSRIQDAVQAEIEKIRAKEASDKEKADIQAQLSKLSEATAEKTPVERRRVHKLMGWGE